jgi:hypothetical protein
MLGMGAQQRCSILVALIALVCGGCDTLHSRQYVVDKASAADRETIKAAVESTAMAAGLTDKTETSKVPDTIAFYLEPVPHFPTSLGARLDGDLAIVDLSCFHPGTKKPAAFKTAESQLTEKLGRAFGERLSMPEYPDRIPLRY